MNKRMISFILGRMLLAEMILMIPSVLVGFLYHEKAVSSFLIPMLLLLVCGLPFALKKPRNTNIYARDGFFIVACVWILFSLAGSLPFYFSGKFNSIWDCIFEIVSGFTTTGASVLSSPESLPKCILFWRSFSHWVGGMGVLVFVLAIIPLSEDRSLHLMRAEVPGPMVGKLVPHMRDTAFILYAVYTVMTLILIGLLCLGKMPLFDSICTAFGTAGTGGFSIRNAGIAYYNSAYIDFVLGIFMMLFGINFNLYYLILKGRMKQAFRSEELRWYLAVIFLSTTFITLNIMKQYPDLFTSIRLAFFQVSSIITTTGFATADFAGLWPHFSRHLLLLLMVIGACAGSTGGGLKVSRILLLLKAVRQEIRRLMHPRLATVVRLEGKPVDNILLRSACVYLILYFFIICISTLLLSIDNKPIATNLSAELSCFNNIGPGIDLVGPMGNYGFYSPFSKILLSLNMLLGRLEIFPIFILFTPSIWRRNVR